MSEVKGKDITELIASGREKLASVPSGGGGVAVAAAPAGGAPSGGGAASAEAKEEKKVEEKEESDDVSSKFAVDLVFNDSSISFLFDIFLFSLLMRSSNYRTWVLVYSIERSCLLPSSEGFAVLITSLVQPQSFCCCKAY